MKITKAKFLKSIVGPDDSLKNGLPQTAFVGRSNVGKSSIINSLANQKQLARAGKVPGRTRLINLFLFNDAVLLLDLPGYGYAKISKQAGADFQSIICGYLFETPYKQKKVALVIDAKIGPTKLDLEMLGLLEKHEKNIVIVANKIDKVKPSIMKKQLADIQDKIGSHKVIPFSAKNKIGRHELLEEIL